MKYGQFLAYALASVITTLLLGKPGTGAEEPGREVESEWAISGSTGMQHQFEAGIDGGGDMDVDRYGVRLGFDLWRGRKQSLALILDVAQHEYDFSGGSGIGDLDPWDGVREISLSSPMRWAFSPKWSMILIPSLGSAFESGADIGDGLTVGVSSMFVYRVSDTLKIGPGLAASTQIEDDASLIPIPYIDWKISDTLSLTTGPGDYLFAAPGVTLAYQVCKKGRIFASAGMEQLRFRLDDDRVAPEGVGEESSVPVAIGVSYDFNPMAKLCLTGGVKFAGEVELEDEDGDRLRREDFDPAGFVGVSFKLRF